MLFFRPLQDTSRSKMIIVTFQLVAIVIDEPILIVKSSKICVQLISKL